MKLKQSLSNHRQLALASAPQMWFMLHQILSFSYNNKGESSDLTQPQTQVSGVLNVQVDPSQACWYGSQSIQYTQPLWRHDITLPSPSGSRLMCCTDTAVPHTSTSGTSSFPREISKPVFHPSLRSLTPGLTYTGGPTYGFQIGHTSDGLTTALQTRVQSQVG